MTKYYLTAFNPDAISGGDYSPIGGLSDITGKLEKYQKLERLG